MKRIAAVITIAMLAIVTISRTGGVSADTGSDVQAALNSSTGAVTGFSLRQIGGPVLAASNTTYQYEPASSIKALIHLHAMLQLQNSPDTTKLGEPIQVATTYVGSCPQWPSPTVVETLQTAMSKMMWQSDNAATDALIR